MASPVSATVTDLPESRVRVEAEVPSAEVERRLEQTARRLGREMKLPGFRKGKVPPPLVIRRMGRDAVLTETLDNSLPRWYTDAIAETGLVTVGNPDLKLGGLPGEGESLKFSVEIGVRPTATLGDYKGVEVGRREAAADPEVVEQRLEAERERLARLEPVERPAKEGDFLVIDFIGSIDGEPFQGGEGRDQPLELGSGSLVPGFEDGLLGAAPGDERTVSVTFPDDYGAEALAGQDAEFAVTVACATTASSTASR